MTKKITLLVALFIATISYGQTTFESLKAKPVASIDCSKAGGITPANGTLTTISYDVTPEKLEKFYSIEMKVSAAVNTVTSIDDLLKYKSGSTDFVILSADSKDYEFPENGCGYTGTGAKIVRAVIEYTPDYIDGASVTTVFEANGGAELTFNLEVNAAVAGIEDLEKFNFSYAPNPTKDFVRLTAVNSIKDVKVFNLIGQEVLQATYNSRNPSIDISDLTAGVYVMKVAIDDSIGTFRIIKE